MRILLGVNRFPPDFSGSGLRAYRLARRLSRKFGHRFTVICDSNRGSTTEEGMHVIRFKAGPESGRNFPAHISNIHKALQHMRLDDFDVLHLFSFPWMNRMLLARSACRRTILECTLDGHDDPSSLLMKGIKNRMVSAWTRSLLEKVSIYAVGSVSSLRSCVEASLDVSKCLLIPRAVDEEVFAKHDISDKNNIRRRLGIPLRNKVFLNIGRIQQRKNQAFLVRSLAKTSSESVLLLIGPAGEDEYAMRLRRLISSEGLGNRVFILGEKENVEEYMVAADALLLASEAEGFPNVVAEALVSGLPVISTGIRCVRPFITPETGLYVCGGPQRFAKALDMPIRYDREKIRRIGLGHFAASNVDALYDAAYRSPGIIARSVR